jgi:[ribosomal protein S5]-alanine N-acetyltransferase
MITLNFTPFPTLTTENFILRQLRVEDVGILFEIRSSPIAMQYLDRPMAKTKEDATALYNTMLENTLNNTAITWAIQHKDNNEMLGYIGFYRIDTTNHRGEIGYTLHPNHFNKGIMSEAMKAVISHGFTLLNFHSIIADINPANEASKKIVEKHGFKQEAYFRENYYYNGNFLDSIIYGLLKSEWV